MVRKISELGMAGKIALANACSAIALSVASSAHTMTAVGSGGVIEVNPAMRLVLGVSPVLALLIAPLVIGLLTYAAWRFGEYAGVSVSSVFLGAAAFDFWTHLYLIAA